MFPSHPRYGPQAGQENDAFLNADMLKEMFLRPLWPHRHKTACADLRIRRVRQARLRRPRRVPRAPGPVPGRAAAAVPLRRGGSQSGVPARRTISPACARAAWRTSTTPGRACRNCGGKSTCPVRPPPVSWCAARCCGKAGHTRKRWPGFSPYSEIRDPNPGARESLRILIQRAREQRHMAFLFVNNRLEGNSPLTIMAVTEPD